MSARRASERALLLVPRDGALDRRTSSAAPDGLPPPAESAEGENSEDEAADVPARPAPAGPSADDGAAAREREKLFERAMRKSHGYFIRRVKADGACLFRAAADQVYGDEDMHASVRREVVEHLRRERDHYSQFVTEDFGAYLARKSQAKTFGNNVEIQALTEVYGRAVEVFRYQTEPSHVFVPLRETLIPGAAPIRLSYHRGNHYNSVRHPLAEVASSSGPPATLNEHLHVTQTLAVSEQQHTEQALMDESRRLADMERTEDEMAAAAIAESLVDLTMSMWRDDQGPSAAAAAAGSASAGGRGSSGSAYRVFAPAAQRRLGSGSPVNGLSRSGSPTGSLGASPSSDSL